MHPRMKTRRALTTRPIEVSLSLLRRLAAVSVAKSVLLSAPYESHAFAWPSSYEAGLRRRTYGNVSKHWQRADCGCLVHVSHDLYVDPRNPRDTICYVHGNIIGCAECGQPSGVEITPRTEALSVKYHRFFCSDLCSANVAA